MLYFDAAKNDVHKKILFLFIGLLIILYKTFSKNLNLYPRKDEKIEEKIDYLINPSEAICGKNKGKDFLVVSFVPSGAKFIKRRQNIRNTWANQTYKQHKLIKNVFLVGRSNDKSISDQIIRESETYGDIIQIDLIDSYKILIDKTFLGLKWMSMYCENAQFIMKVDDDMVVNTKYLLNFFLSLSKEDSFNKIYGSCDHKFNLPIRNISDKHYISKEDYLPDTWPKYWLGPSYILAHDTLKPLNNLSKFIRKFPMEDAYVGLLAKDLKIDLIDVKNWMLEYYPPIWQDSKCNEIRNLTETNFLFINIDDSELGNFHINWDIIVSKY